MENHPKTESNFIGFVNGKGETVQFVHLDDKEWIVDVPIVKNEEVEIWQANANTEEVKRIIALFSNEQSWRSIVELTKMSRN